MPSRGLCFSLRLLFCLLTVAVVSPTAFSQGNDRQGASQSAEALKTLLSIDRPLTFEANQGQSHAGVRFLSRGRGYELFLTPDEATVSLSKNRQGRSSNKSRATDPEVPESLRLKLEGANRKASVIGEEELAAKSNYYIGNDPAKWRIAIPNYARVRYASIYPGIDLVYYGNERLLEHDFLIAPGADPRRIRISLLGGKFAHVDENGDLVIQLGDGTVRLLKPVVYQETAGLRHEISASYELSSKNTVRFSLGKYDKRRALVIDPKLSYATYLGGSGVDYGYGVAVQGSTVYVTGNSGSTDFLGTTSHCCTFVTALNVTSGLVYSTYISAEVTGYFGNPIAVDNSGNAYITGTTFGGLPIASSGLPTTYQGGRGDGFVSKISPTGTLLASGYLGGVGFDYGQGIAFDPVNSHVLVTGATESTNFPTLNAALGILPGQLYTTPNAGSTWSLTSGSGSTSLGSMDIRTILIVPGTLAPTTYYVGGSAGVYKSTDGVNWTAFGTGLVGKIAISLAYDPSSGFLYAGTDGGIYQYLPAIGQWSYLSSGPPDTISAVVVNPTTPSTVYATDTQQGFYVSTNSGSTWTLQNSGLPVDVNGFAYGLSFGLTNAGTLYASVYNGSNGTGPNPNFYVSTNGGASWSAPTDNGFPYVRNYSNHNGIFVDNAGGRIFYAANGGAFVSSDGGANWTQLGTLSGYSNNFNAIVPDPSNGAILYAGTDNGLFKSSDSGTTWAQVDTFSATSVGTIAVDTVASSASGQTVLYAGSNAGQGFEMSLDSSLNPVFSTLIGGDGSAPNFQFFSNGYATAADAQGNVFVTGNTYSTAAYLPGSASGAQPNPPGNGEDGFLLKLSPTGSALWSTFVGGTSNDYGQGVAVASDGSAVVAGFTYSSDLPVTPGAYQSFCSCSGSAFFAKYSSSGANLFTTYFAPQNANITPLGVALDPNANVYFVASSQGKAPIVNPLDQPLSRLANGSSGYVAELNSTGSALLFSTPLGGSTPNTSTYSDGIAIDAAGAVYVTGYTNAPDFSIAGSALQTVLNRGAANGNADAFLVQISSTAQTNDVAIQATPGAPTVAMGGTVQYNLTVSNLTATGTGASNVVLSTDLPLATLSSTAGTCTVSPARCAFGTVAPGATVTATATATYSTVGTFANTFSARTDDNDPNPANNSQIVTATVTGASGSDIGVMLTGPSEAPRNGQFVYTLTLTNYGPAAATSVQSSVSLSPSLFFVTADTGCFNDGGVFCSVATLNAGASQSFNITVQAPSTVGTVTSSASVNYSGDPNSGNNSASATTTIVPSADLSGYFTQNNSAVVGAPSQMMATVFNGGPDNVSNVTLTLNIPPQLTLTSIPAGCTGTGTITCTIGAISVDASPNLQFSIVANAPGVYTLVGTVQDLGGSADPTPSDNQFTLAVQANVTNNYQGESIAVSLTDSGQIGILAVGSTSPQYATTIKANSAPAISAIDISGRYMYVTAGGFAAYTSVIDTSIGQEVARIHGVGGRPMALTPDGSRLLVHDISGPTDALDVIDTTTFQIVKTISLDGMFNDQVGTKDLNITSGVIANNKLYLQLSNSPGGIPLFTTAVIDLGTYTVNQVSGAASTPASQPGQQHTIAASADGKRVYALMINPQQLLVIDTSSDTVIDTVPLPLSTVTSIVTTRDPNDSKGQFAYIGGLDANGSGMVLDFSLAGNTVLADQATTSFFPTNLALSADGTYLYAVQNNRSKAGNNAGLFTTQPLTAANSGTNEFSIPGIISGLSIGFISLSPYPYAPSITSAVPPSLDNSVANKLTILGSNFAPNSRVKVGSLDQMAATFVSTGRLDVNIPAFIPEEDASIVVTLPNSQELPTARNVSGRSYFRLPIRSSTFSTLPSSLLLMEFGDSTLNLIDPAKNGVKIATLPNPTSVALSPDNQTVYVATQYRALGVQAISLSTGQQIANIPVPNDFVGYQNGLATGTDPVDGKAVLYFDSGDANFANDQLTIVDADSTSATFNQVKRRIATTDATYSRASGALAASPSGRYVYTFADVYNHSTNTFVQTNIVAYDVLTGAFGQIQNVNSSFNGEANLTGHMQVSPDGNWLLVPGDGGGIKALNISADPLLSNFTVTTIGDASHHYKTFQVFGSRLFAFDANTNTVAAFNFLPASNDFSELGTVTLPGPTSYFEAPLLVDPTGTYVYVGLKDQDAIAALDANKIAASDPTALLDEGGNNFGIEAILIPGAVTPQVDLAASMSGNTTSFAENGSAVVSATVTNNSIGDAHNVVATITPPSGLTITTAAWYTSGNNFQSGLCTIGATVTCTIPVLAGGSSGGDIANISLAFTAPSASQSPLAFSMSVTGNETDPNLSNNSANTSITIVPGADISVTATFPSGTVTVGQHLTYTVTVNNAGPAPAVSFSAFISSDLSNFSVVPPAGITCQNFTSEFSCTVNPLNVIGPQVFMVSGDVPGNLNSIFFSASVGSQTADPDYSNNQVADGSVTVQSNGTLSPQFLVSDFGGGKIYGIGPSTATSVMTANAGITPSSIVALPSGRTAFIENGQAGYTTVLDLTVQKEIYRIYGERGPLALSSDASKLYLANTYAFPQIIDIFDTTTFQKVGTISLSALGANVSVADIFLVGQKLFVVQASSAPMYVIDLANNNSATAITGSQARYRAGKMAATPDGATLMAIAGRGTTADPFTLYRINVASGTLQQTMALTGNPSSVSIAITPIVGSNIYAYISTGSTLQVFDLTPGSPTLNQFLPNVNVALPISPSNATITSDGVTLGMIQPGVTVNPNVVTINTASILNTPSIVPGSIGRALGGIATVQADFLQPTSAPQITSITPGFAINDAPQILQIAGSGFSTDAMVKIGAANPIAATFISTTQLSVTLPQLTPSGLLDVVVINVNGSEALNLRNVASLSSSLTIADPPSFTPPYDSVIANYGGDSVTTYGSTTSGTTSINLEDPLGIAITDSGIWFVSTFDGPNLISSLSSEGFTTITTSGGSAYGDAIGIAPDPATGRTAAFEASEIKNPTSGNADWQLNIVDADPYSPTVNNILRTIRTNLATKFQTPQGFAVTPDGKFAYLLVYTASTSGQGLAIFDVASGTVTVIDSAPLGIDSFDQSMQVSPDGHYLAIANFYSNNIKVLNVSTPTSPVVAATIPVTVPNGQTVTDCCNLRIVNNKLYVIDPSTMLLQMFNFNPATPDFSAIGSVQLPGHTDPALQGGIAVTPDGAYVYIGELDDDAVEVIDASKIAGGNISQALVTRFQTDRGPASLAFDSVPRFSATADLSVSVSHTPDPVALGSNITYQITATNLGPNTSGQVVVLDVLPPGVTFVSASFSGSNTGLCSGTSVVNCSFGAMTANANTVITLVASTNGAAAGQLVNTVQIGQSQGALPDPNPANNTATDTATAAEPDLAVAVVPDNSSPFVGGTVNYTITVTNNGLVAATGVTLQGTLDAGTFSNVGGCSLNSSTSIVCAVGILNSTQSQVINVSATMPGIPRLVHFTSVASENEVDANPADNTVVSTVTANPSMGTVSGIITYSRSDSGAGTVWKASGDGSSDAQITVGNWPRPSRDQRYIVFHCCANPPNYQGGAYVRDVIAGTNTQVFANNDYQNGYTFTLDDSQIYLDYACGEYKMNRDGSGFTTVFQVDCYDDNPRFNPAGTQLAFENAHAGIGLFNPDGSGRAFIPNTAPGDYMPAWSPDGTHIAFVRFTTGGANNVYVINPDGTGLTPLTSLTAAGDGPQYGSIAWTPDQTSVVFAGLVNGVSGLYSVDSDGSGAVNQLNISAGSPPNWVGDVSSITGFPDLTVSVSADNLAPTANGTVNFTIGATNNGTVAATNVSIASTIDAGFLALPNMPGCSLNGSTFTCTFASIAPGQSVSYVEASQMPSAPGPVHLTTVATETEPDANPADNTVTTTVTVGGGADIAVNAGGAPVVIGGVPTYTVVVTNNGPASASNVVLTDTLTRFQFVSATTTAGSCSYNGLNVSCALGTMANGASVTVNVSVTPPDSGWASNEFHATSNTFDPVPTNNIANMGPFGGTVGNTKAGANVLVDALDATSGTSVDLLFSSITKPGLTTVTSAAGTQLPSGYRFGKPALVYDLSTTAAYTGNIRVSLQLAGITFHHPNSVRLFHLENGAWVDRTTSVDSVHGLITAITTSLSPFVVVEPLNSVPVANAGADQTLPGAGSNGAVVTLNGAASTDADSDPLTYTWTGPFPEGNGTITGVSPKVTMPLGSSKVILVVNDGEADSAPAIANVTVSDFLIAAPTSQITLMKGQSASFNVVLTPRYGTFDEAVTVACGALPAGVTCSLADNSVTPGAQGATATVTLTASSSAQVRPLDGPVFAFWMGGLPVFGIIFTGIGKRKNRTIWMLVLLVTIALTMAMVACGGGGGSSAIVPSTSSSSTTTTITVTGTAGALEHSSTATVVIQ